MRTRPAAPVEAQIRRHLPYEWCRPSIIAHSLGTTVAHLVLQRMATQPWRNVIFIGSPLPRRTRWGYLLGDDAWHVRHLHNELAQRDFWIGWAHRLEPILGWWTKFGGAGYKGFTPHRKDPRLIIHNIGGLMARCPDCGPRGNSADVHNVSLMSAHHSSALLTADHAQDAWLPVLLGFNARHYAELIEASCLGYRYLQCRDPIEARRLMVAMGTIRGYWRPLSQRQDSLLEYAAELLEVRLPRFHLNGKRPFLWKDHAAIYFCFFESLFQLIATGVLQRGAPQPDLARRACLCPQHSVDLAVRHVCELVERGLIV